MSDALTPSASPTVEDLTHCGLSREQAEGLRGALLAGLQLEDPKARWRWISKRVLRPELPFALHQFAFRCAYRDHDPGVDGPAPGWIPSDEEVEESNLGHAMSSDYAAFHAESLHHPDVYWRLMLLRLGIVYLNEPDAVLDLRRGAEHARWLSGMLLNIAESIFARRSARTAVIWRREGETVLHHRTLGELEHDCDRVARALTAQGFEPGDAIAVAMPMTYESVVIYLGIVMFGGAVVSIADSFAPDEIATRLRIAGAKGIFTQDVIARGGKKIPLFDRVVAARAPRAVVLRAAGDGAEPPALRDGDQSWQDFLVSGDGVIRKSRFHIADVGAVTNILFSSGTTGDPKAIAWSHATPIKAAADGWAHHDIRRGDVVAWPTNLGWMMGPWLIYASLLNDAAIALFDGSPTSRAFCEFVRDARVTMLGVVPSLVKAWMSSGATDGVDWSAIRCFSSTGEASSPDEMLWLMSRAGYKPVIEYCGGTEIGGGYITGTVVQPQAPATFSTPALGSDFVIIDEHGQPCESGELALIPPMLGSSDRLLNRDHHEVYFADMPRGPHGEVLRRHGDQMQRLPGGYYRAHGRVDDTMNLGGIKVSSAEIERVVGDVDGVLEAAAIAVSPPEGGPSQLVVFAVLNEGVAAETESLRAAMARAIRERLNPLFHLEACVVVDALPRTASNKVMRRVLRQRYAER